MCVCECRLKTLRSSKEAERPATCAPKSGPPCNLRMCVEQRQAGHTGPDFKRMAC